MSAVLIDFIIILRNQYQSALSNYDDLISVNVSDSDILLLKRNILIDDSASSSSSQLPTTLSTSVTPSSGVAEGLAQAHQDSAPVKKRKFVLACDVCGATEASFWRRWQEGVR